MKTFSMRLTRRCSAPPEAIYDAIADLRTHLDWGGAKQIKGFRLLSLDAPVGTATVGTSFSSTGSIPMSLRRFADTSTVTMAERPVAFEFVTHATVYRSRRSLDGTYRHRYTIEATPGGSTVTYELAQLELVNPFLRLALPVIRTITWRAGIPLLGGLGFRNLLRLAEQRAPVGAPVSVTP